jgi:outer membrane immunogenic protein
LATVLLPLGAAAAVAADTAPSASWAGGYVGLQTGLELTRDQWKTNSVGPNNVFGVDPTTSPASLDGTGGRVGLYGGWNFAVDPHVIAGIEADFAGVFGGKKTVTGIPGASYSTSGGAVAADSFSARQDWDAGVRARLGYAVDRDFLVYGTTGLALADIEYKASCPSNSSMSWCGQPESGKVTKTAVGWTIGAGAEGKLDQALSVRVEYRYAGFDSQKVNFFQGVNSGADGFAGKSDPSSHIVTIGLTYHFGSL